MKRKNFDDENCQSMNPGWIAVVLKYTWSRP